MTGNIDPERYTMRKPCPMCGGKIGRLAEVGRQDTVRCISCDTFVYNAPRTETGRTVRSVTTVHNAIKPKQRARVLGRDGNRCQWCKRDDRPLHVGHIVSVEAGLAFGLSDEEINDDENLVAQCDECNLGLGAEPIPLRCAIAIVRARRSWRDKHEGKK